MTIIAIRRVNTLCGRVDVTLRIPPQILDVLLESAYGGAHLGLLVEDVDDGALEEGDMLVYVVGKGGV